MSEVLQNKTILKDIITKELSNYSATELPYSWDEVITDAAMGISNFWNSVNVDKRVVAVGADFYIHSWDLYAGMMDGWKDRTYVCGGLYAQMLCDLKLPQTALISSPDRHFDLVALLASRNVNLYFMNNDSLYNFENFIRDLQSYPFEFTYNVVNYQDIILGVANQFDFVQVQASDLVIDIELVNSYLSHVSPGGVVYMPYANEEGRLYTEDYYVEPITDVYEIVSQRDDFYSYHIPNAIGFQVLIRK